MASFEKRMTKDGRARWTARVFCGREPSSGKKRFAVKTFGRKKDATKWARRMESMKDRGAVPAVTSKEPFAEYLERWLDVKAGQVRPRTIHGYRSTVRRYVAEPPEGAPPIGVVALNRLTTEAFDELYAWMRDEGLSPRTIRGLHVVLRMALKDAVGRDLLVRNPTDHAKPPKRAKGEDASPKRAARSMDRDEAEAFLRAATEDRYSALWHVLLLGGLRPSEAFALGWEHVDVEEGSVYVERTITRVGVEGWQFAKPKTDRSRREVHLPAVAMQALREWRAAQARERLQLGAEWEDNGLVFTNEFGRPVDGSNLRSRSFREVCARAGIGEWESKPEKPARGPRRKRRFNPSIRMYDLRHTHATLLLLAGEDLDVVSKRLGHASIVLTSNTYSHFVTGRQKQAADRLERMFGT